MNDQLSKFKKSLTFVGDFCLCLSNIIAEFHGLARGYPPAGRVIDLRNSAEKIKISAKNRELESTAQEPGS